MHIDPQTNNVRMGICILCAYFLISGGRVSCAMESNGRSLQERETMAKFKKFWKFETTARYIYSTN